MEMTPWHALVRFGLGRRGREALPDDPGAWRNAQLKDADPAKFPELLPSAADGLTLVQEQNKLHLPFMQLALQADIVAQAALLLSSPAPFRERLVWFWANHFTISTRQGPVTALAGPYARETIRPHVTGTFFDMLPG